MMMRFPVALVLVVVCAAGCLDDDTGCVQECRELGLCTYSYEQSECIATSEADCREATRCMLDGLCSLSDRQCSAQSDADCQQSQLCKQEGACRAQMGLCVTYSPDGSVADGAGLDAGGQDGGIDAATDGPLTPVGADQVNCGAQTCDLKSGEICCAPFSGASCITTSCSGAPALACDGPEDCGAEPCCFDTINTTGECGIAACKSGDQTVCHSRDDCPTSQKHCCLQVFMTDTGEVALGRCEASPPAGDVCD